MQMSTVDRAFWLASFACQVGLLGLLIRRQDFIRFPTFCIWIGFCIVNDAMLFWIAQHSSAVAYSHAHAFNFDYDQAYVVSSVIDYLLQLGVLAEIALRVLRPSRRRLPKAFFIVLGGAILVGTVTCVLWLRSSRSGGTAVTSLTATLLHLDFGFSYLRLAVFAAIAGFSQMLGITWRNHVIRLAGGLAFYSAISVVTQVSINHLTRADYDGYVRDYYLLSRLQVCAYIGALLFWVWSFVQKDAPRREFTPQMQHFLVTLSETAKRSRLGLTRSLGHK